jgi:hypothetical protein
MLPNGTEQSGQADNWSGDQGGIAKRLNTDQYTLISEQMPRQEPHAPGRRWLNRSGMQGTPPLGGCIRRSAVKKQKPERMIDKFFYSDRSRSGVYGATDLDEIPVVGPFVTQGMGLVGVDR